MTTSSRVALTKILFLSAEASPYSKVGGLGDVSGSLPPLLSRLYPDLLDIRMVLPYHSDLNLDLTAARIVCKFQASVAYFDEYVTVWQDQAAAYPVYFLQSETLSKSPPYSDDSTVDLIKYAMFSHLVHDFINQLQWNPDIIHANDWHTALFIYQIGTKNFKQASKIRVKTILSIHNLPYMGAGNKKILKSFGINPSKHQDLPDWARTIPLPMGMGQADLITTVSSGYAQEIMTPQFGCGLEEFLKANSHKLRGILNGIDPDEWDPTADPLLTANFSHTTLQKRAANKTALFHTFFPGIVPEHPLLIWIGRLQAQKGADILINTLKNLITEEWHCIILGTGDPGLEEAVLNLSKQHPHKIQAVMKFDHALSHQLYAGGDAIIMPSRYEPCGLSQMFAMRYGCLPIATATGGLKDTISDQAAAKNPDGFLFQEATAAACSDSVKEALHLFAHDPHQWHTMQINAMVKDFSWHRSAEEYKNVYIELWENR
jgi:starch synthase